MSFMHDVQRQSSADNYVAGSCECVWVHAFRSCSSCPSSSRPSNWHVLAVRYDSSRHEGGIGDRWPIDLSLTDMTVKQMDDRCVWILVFVAHFRSSFRLFVSTFSLFWYPRPQVFFYFVLFFKAFFIFVNRNNTSDHWLRWHVPASRLHIGLMRYWHKWPI